MSLPIELHYQIALLSLEDANSSSSNILPLLLVHPVWTAFLLPRVYARPRVTARTLASFIAALAHRPDRLRIPQALVWTGPVGGVSGLLASLLDTLSEQLETIEMRRVAVEGLEGATSLWAVLAAMNPVRADIEVIVLEAVKGRNEEAAVDHHIPAVHRPTHEAESIKPVGCSGDLWRAVSLAVADWTRWHEGALELVGQGVVSAA